MNINFKYENVDNSDMSYTLRQKLISLGLKAIRVPIRMNGISSQGEYMQCHANVKKIVQKYGGKRLIGQTLKVHEDGAVEAFNHSVWITPENKVVDICKANRSKEELEKGYIVFIPRMIDENPNTLHEETIHFDFVLAGNKYYVLHPFAVQNGAMQCVHKSKARTLLNNKYNYSLEKMMSLNTYLEDVSLIKKLLKKTSMIKKFGWKVLEVA